MIMPIIGLLVNASTFLLNFKFYLKKGIEDAQAIKPISYR
ncbi:hypothetical protein MD484_g2041, partial [Candolleomyces efflorescens]